MNTERRGLIVGALIWAGLAIFVSSQLRVVTDIAHFLPASGSNDDVHLARELASGELSRTMVVLIDAEDATTAARASQEFEVALRAEPRVQAELLFLDSGPAPGVEDALWQTYESRRLGFLATTPEAAAAKLTPEALSATAESLKRRLASPMSSLISRVAPSDPLLILPGILRRLMGGVGDGLRVFEGRFLTTSGSGAVLLLATKSPASDGSVMRPFLAGLHAAFERVNAQFQGGLTLGVSGTQQFAVRAETAIRTDIQRVGIGSSVGLTLFLLLMFRSLRVLLLVAAVLTSAFLTGATACQLMFGSVHGLTLAFGAALIGVSADYAIHFQCHHAFAPSATRGRHRPRDTLRAIWTPLVVGAATTVVGFLALMLSAFPGLRQLAAFAVFGILAAVLSTRLIVPGLAAPDPRPTGASQRVVTVLRHLLNSQGRRRLWLWVPTAAVAVVAATGLPSVIWNDDISALNRLDPELLAADEAVRSRVVRYEQRRLVVAVGADEQAALEVNDAVARALQQATEQNQLGGWRSMATLVPSAEQQRQVAAVATSDPGLWDRARAALVGAGFRAEAFEPFRESLAGAARPGGAPEPLVPSDLVGTPLEPMVRPFRVTLDDQAGYVSFLHQLRDEPALRSAIEAIPGARLIDIEATLTGVYGAYRQRMMQLWLIGMAAVLLLVSLRHRAVRPTLIAYLPAVLAAAGTIGLLSWCGEPLNMLSLVALLMVVSMGVDYGVFLAETHLDARRLDATYLAVFVAGISTVLGFGLLAFSDQPPLRSIGLTSGVGVLLSLVLAPTTCALTARSPR